MTDRFKQIDDVFSLCAAASDFHARLLRMSPKENGEPRVSPGALASLTEAAERLGVVSKFNGSARGVVFLQKKEAVLNGAWPLKHIEAESVAGYVARQARKACEPRLF